MSGPVASTSAGLVQGRTVGVGGRTVLAFGGVPYAHPPVGDHRFSLPAPVASWSGIRSATESGAGAPQAVGDELVPDMTPSRQSEDCLTAEITTPDLSGSRPVLVWIPGGAFLMGAAGLATYDGAPLAAAHELVVVGLNYRLGALGFLARPDVPTNLGLRDLIAGLHWIRDEISGFGGDPERVTLMGESAGAGAIAHLLAAPSSHGLYTGAILQSGAPNATLDHPRAAAVGDHFCSEAGTGEVKELRRLPVEAIVAAQERTGEAMLNSIGKMPFHPVIDDDLLPHHPLATARAGRLAPVPLVVGSTSDEMALFADQVPQLPDEIIDLVLTTKLAALGGTVDPSMVEAGRRATDHDLALAIADLDLHLPAALLADFQCRSGQPTWRYRFDWQGAALGAAHAYDLPFTFGTLDVANWREVLGAAPGGAADRLSRRMGQAWASFATIGAPECEPIGEWPTHRPDNWAAVVLGSEVTAVDDFDRSRLESWQSRGNG